LLLSACAARPRDLNDVHREVDAHLAAHRERVVAARTDFARRRPFPRVERSAEGTVILERAELIGRLDEEYLRLRVTYVNETERIFDRVQLSFSVTDGLGRVRSQRYVDFVMPLAYRFTPGSSYTDEVHVPTGGAHEVPGWDLAVEVATETW
jgi:hypothetical protein